MFPYSLLPELVVDPGSTASGQLFYELDLRLPLDPQSLPYSRKSVIGKEVVNTVYLR